MTHSASLKRVNNSGPIYCTQLRSFKNTLGKHDYTSLLWAQCVVTVFLQEKLMQKCELRLQNLQVECVAHYFDNYHFTWQFKSDLVFLDVLIRINLHEKYNLVKSSRTTHTVTSPYTHCILIHEARSLVFMIIITEQFSILHKLLMIFR